ncbi:MAG TPA: flagellar basal-body MS-ring/collar protein FliF [Sedimentisphaerales bacterium]|nr:flagellar basal-body MS-ring/collar protein FliF [Sedimentisphaerales bacterium]
MGLVEQIQAIWNKTTLVQRALVLALVIACFLTATALTKWASRPSFALLYRQVSLADAGKITDQLTERGVPYELRGNGTSIYVPDDQVHQLRLDMAQLGLPEADQGGYRIFDEQKIGTSPFVQGVNLNRALQDELARSIQMIEGVQHARVHLVRPEQSLFGGQSARTSASVVLRLSGGGHLSQSNIAAITHLVAGSVENLKAENVTIVDSAGRLLSTPRQDGVAAGANTFLEHRERVENSLAARVEAMLTTVLGHGRSSVRVSAVIDMSSENLVTERYDPQKVVTREEITSRSRSQQNPQAAADGGDAGGDTETEETITTEFMVGKTVTQTVNAPGTIVSMSVSAVVDLYPGAAATEGDGAEAAPDGELIMSVEQVRALITNALGLRDGVDSIEVVNTRFYRPVEPEAAETTNWAAYLAITKQASLGIMAVCALLALKIFSGKGRKVSVDAAQLAGGAGAAQQMLTGGGAGAGGLPAPSMMRDQIIIALQQNPEHVRRMFTSWVQERE